MIVNKSENTAVANSAVSVPDFHRPVHCVVGLPFDALDTAQTVQLLLAHARAGRRNFFSTPNLNFLVASGQDRHFRDSVLRSDLSLADGMPIVWMARLLGIPIATRVAGSTVFEQLRAQRTQPVKVFFFGGPDGVAQQAADALNADGGVMTAVGAYSPGFGTLAEMSAPDVIARINASGADLLVVALGAKRGQAWIEHNLAALRVPLVSHLGAVVNFVAGTVSRAPSRVGGLGLEWIWRIKEEPALWRRYWQDGLALLRLMATRVLPAAVLARNPGSAAPVLHERDEGAHRVLTLDGAWRAEALAPLRAALARACDTARPVDVVLAANCGLDSAALGLLLLLYGHQSKLGASFTLRADGARARRTLRLHNVAYLAAGLPATVAQPA